MSKSKKALSIVLAVLMFTMTVVSASAAKAFPFEDANMWAKDSIQWAYENGITNGTSENKFSPNVLTTRAAFITMLWRMAGEPPMINPLSYSTYPDIPTESASYFEAVYWATNNGIIFGYGDGTFRPLNAIKREDMAVIIKRYYDYLNLGEEDSAQETGEEFADMNTVSAYAKDAVLWSLEKGLINGKTENTISPKESATRAEVVTILHRLSNLPLV